MKAIIACALGVQLLLSHAALAQTQEAQAEETVQKPVAAPKFTVTQLLSRGFEVKAMSFTNSAVILILQGGIDAFVCETDVRGNTRACVALK